MDAASYPEAKFATAKEWHLYYVYNDPDFIKPALELRKKYKFKERRGNYIESGMDMISQLMVAQKDNKWNELRDEYCITDQDLIYFMRGGYKKQRYINASLDEYMGHVQLDAGVIINVQLAPHITYDGYMKLWDKVKELRDQIHPPTKRKPLENPDLIYAIFKANKTMNFGEIFSLYQTGNLPGYKGSTEQFDTKEKLKSYYKLHRPTTRG